MRLWAEERKSGTLELLFTLPVSVTQAMLGKFLAAWAFVALALALSFPMWLTVNYLGDPDNGVILAGYLGSLLMAGAFLAVGCCLSATTRSQVVAFILTVAVCFLLVMAGMPASSDLLSGLLPPEVAATFAQISILRAFPRHRARRAGPAGHDLFRPHHRHLADGRGDGAAAEAGGLSACVWSGARSCCAWPCSCWRRSSWPW